MNINGTEEERTLAFTFHFYGQLMRKLVVNRDGYLLVPEHIRPELEDAKLIAPFPKEFTRGRILAKFPAPVSESEPEPLDFERELIVQWTLMMTPDSELGSTFQAVVYGNGTTVFNYATLEYQPADPLNLKYYQVHLGISDSFFSVTPDGR